MTTDPQTDYAATIAERTVCVTWPDNDRGGATPPPDGWQDRAWEQPTLHEIDEGSITGCSVLRWRDDPRSDAELLAVSLALVTGQVVPPAAAAPPAVRPELRDQIAEAIARSDSGSWGTELETMQPYWRNGYLAYADAVLSVLPATTNRAAVLREEAARIRAHCPDHLDSESAEGSWMACHCAVADDMERRMAVEAQQPAETAVTAAPEIEPWQGATELASNREIADRAASGLVGYRQGRGTLLHCLAHKPAPASRWADFHEVTADDLHDGGLCVHPRCGRDLLAQWPAMPAPAPPRPPHCVCGAPIEWMDVDDSNGGWIHSPGSDTPCLNARPRCPLCQMPHDLTPGSMGARACESIRARITEAGRRHAEGDHGDCVAVDCETVRARRAAQPAVVAAVAGEEPDGGTREAEAQQGVARHCVEYFLQSRETGATWEGSSSSMCDLADAAERLAKRRNLVPGFEYRIAQRTTTVNVQPLPDCLACRHWSCNGDGPCGALLDAWQRCTCTGPDAAVSQPGKEA